MVDMQCPANVTLIADGGVPGHTNGHDNKARFRNPAGIVMKENGKLSACDQGNGKVRVVFAHPFLSRFPDCTKGRRRKPK